MGILAVLSKWKRSPKFAGIRKYTNLLYYDPNKVCIPMGVADYIVVDDCKFALSDQLNMMQRIKGNYWFAHVRATDRVIDLGANVGVVAIPLARKAKRVLAVEPVATFHKGLSKNVELNDLKNVTLYPYAVGNGDLVKIGFAGYGNNLVRSVPLNRIVEASGGVDFLKVDIEGYEWGNIYPEDCDKIAEVRFEFHIRRRHKKEDLAEMARWWRWAKATNRYFCMEEAEEPLHPTFVQCWLFAASTRGELKDVRTIRR